MLIINGKKKEDVEAVKETKQDKQNDDKGCCYFDWLTDAEIRTYKALNKA